MLLKKSHDESFVRYNDVNKNKIVPLQLKIESFHLWKLHMFTSGITLVAIESDDEELFIKCREIRDEIAELMGIHDHNDLLELMNMEMDLLC